MKTLCSHTPLPYKPATGPTVGDIFREYGPAFRASNNLHPRQHKVMYDIEHCRRGEFGTHWEICDTCGHLEKDTTPARTATAQAATISPGANGWRLGSTNYFRSLIIIAFSPCLISSIHYAALTAGLCTTFCLKAPPRPCWSSGRILNAWGPGSDFTGFSIPGAESCGSIRTSILLSRQAG